MTIQQELEQRLEFFRSIGKLLEAQRIKERTLYDLEMLKVLGYCSGIENYSRHIDGRAPGMTPYTMLDYFPDDFMTFIDESHVTVPQIGGMANGDRARKQTLVDYGFRLPSAHGQPPAELRRVYEQDRADRVRVGHARPLRARGQRQSWPTRSSAPLA